MSAITIRNVDPEPKRRLRIRAATAGHSMEEARNILRAEFAVQDDEPTDRYQQIRNQPDRTVAAWLAARPSSSLFITTITQAELLDGLQLLPDGKRRASETPVRHGSRRVGSAATSAPSPRG